MYKRQLFAGVGGFRVGLNNITDFRKKDGCAIEKNGWNFVWANQYEPSTKAQHAFECYSKRFQIGECSNEDINKVDKKTIPNHSLLVGGFPCQDYSVARSISGEKGIAGKTVSYTHLRGMSINLGFAYFDLPSGKRCGVVRCV